MSESSVDDNDKNRRLPAEDDWLRSLASTLRNTAQIVSANGRSSQGEIASPLSDLLTQMGELLDVVDAIRSKPVEDTDFCLGSVSKILQLTVTKTARKLAEFCERNYCELTFESTAGAFTGALLSEHMKRLQSGDYYHVVSDVASWRDDQLDNFQTETKQAVGRTVSIRRVFNLLLPEAKYSYLEQRDKQEILKKHLEDSQEWNANGTGEYIVRVFGEAQLDQLMRKKPGLKFREDTIKGTHFGMFSRGPTDRTLVEYEVKEHDLSVIYLWKGTDATQMHRQIFDDIWDVSSPLTIEAISEITLI
jgi:hypothetical protein